MGGEVDPLGVLHGVGELAAEVACWLVGYRMGVWLVGFVRMWGWFWSAVNAWRWQPREQTPQTPS